MSYLTVWSRAICRRASQEVGIKPMQTMLMHCSWLVTSRMAPASGHVFAGLLMTVAAERLGAVEQEGLLQALARAETQ